MSSVVGMHLAFCYPHIHARLLACHYRPSSAAELPCRRYCTCLAWAPDAVAVNLCVHPALWWQTCYATTSYHAYDKVDKRKKRVLMYAADKHRETVKAPVMGMLLMLLLSCYIALQAASLPGESFCSTILLGRWKLPFILASRGTFQCMTCKCHSRLEANSRRKSES